MKSTRNERVPRRYNLGWNSVSKTIMIEVHKDCLEFISNPVPKNHWLVKSHSDYHNFFSDLFDSFSGDLASEWFGFNKAIRGIGRRDDYLILEAALPRIKMPTGLTCKRCDGTGKRLEEYTGPNETCSYCKGSGKEREIDWRDATTFASSLNLLFKLLDFSEETSAREPQHIDLVMKTGGCRGSTYIGGWLGADICNHLSEDKPEFQNSVAKTTTSAMKLANMWMYEDNGPYIRTECSDQGIHLQVDSDACYVNTSFRGRAYGSKCEFSDHNVDHYLQQLTLLAGLSSLVSQVDASIKNTAVG